MKTIEQIAAHWLTLEWVSAEHKVINATVKLERDLAPLRDLHTWLDDYLYERARAFEDSNEDAFDAYVEWTSPHDSRSFEDAYMGEWESWQQYVDNYVDECVMPYSNPSTETLQNYFDYGTFANALQYDYTVIDAPDGRGVWVFSNF